MMDGPKAFVWRYFFLSFFLHTGLADIPDGFRVLFHLPLLRVEP